MSYELTSPDFEPGATLPTWARARYAGGEDRSPALEWRGAPDGTQSFVLTLFDPDAPRASGWWHWAVRDLPGTLESLPQNAGAPDAGLLPADAFTHPNEEGDARYSGAGPPRGHGPHRYVFTLSALSVDHLEVDPSASAAMLTDALRDHELGRAELIGISETK